MITERYQIDSDEAKKVPRFYQEGHEFQVSGLNLTSRENGHINAVTYNLEGYTNATCELIMSSLHTSLIKQVNLSGIDTQFDDIKKTVESALGIKLLHSLSS